MQEVTIPIFKDLVRLFLKLLGPKLPTTPVPCLQCTDSQNKVVCDIEAVLNLHRRRHEVTDSFKGSLPKTMYWIGTGCLLNGTIANFWRSALRKEEHLLTDNTLSDQAFGASVRFALKRYLHGQAVLSATIYEQAWIGRDVPYEVPSSDLTPMLVRILRGCPGTYITKAQVLNIASICRSSLHCSG